MGSPRFSFAPRLLTRWLALIILAALGFRLALALYLGDSIEEVRGGTWDQITYDLLAQRVAGGHGFTFAQDWWPATRAGEPTAHWSYPYTLFLAAVYALVGHHPLVARLIQAALIGFLMPLLAYRLGRRAFSPPVGLIAAAITAVYFYFAHYSASLMTEAAYITALLWTVDAVTRFGGEMAQPGSASASSLWKRGIELGLAIATALLFRQVFVVLLPVLFGWLLWLAWRQGRLRQVTQVLAVAVTICVLVIVPWLIRNYRAFGVVTLMPNTNSGFAFFWANHPIYGTRFESVLSPDHGVSYQDLIPAELRHLNEAALDRALLRRGLQFIVEDPGRYLLLSLSRIPIYFLFWPTPESTLLSNAARVLSFGLLFPFMLAGLYLAIRRLCRFRQIGAPSTSGVDTGSASDLHPEPVILFLLLILVYTTVHVLSWANVRYRLPVDALLILFAAYALQHLWPKLLALIGKAERLLDPD